jgi:hypothetical protein
MRVWERESTSERAAEPAAVQPASRRRYVANRPRDSAYHVRP